jgi:hypothetical protein
MNEQGFISQKEYLDLFSCYRSAALAHALDIRKFEIELYWKRAAYFWTLLAAIFAAFMLLLSAQKVVHRDDMLVIVACLGQVFSFAWYCVNRGSKFWQENWENHVDMLENQCTGPLYKTVLSRPVPEGFGARMEYALLAPRAISVSMVNQIISVFVVVLWLGLLIFSLLPMSSALPLNWVYVGLVCLTFSTCVAFLTLGKSFQGGYGHRAKLRRCEIEDP